MEILSNLMLGFTVATTPTALLMCFVGVTLGTLVGVLPGIGPLAGVSLLLPLTFHLDPTEALIMLAGIYYGAQYGGSIASILLNLPGDASASITCLDGHPMARKGRGGAALFLTAMASFVGGCFSIVLMAGLAPTLASVALRFGSPEYASLMTLGLLAAATLSASAPLKGLAMVLVGLLVGLVGADAETGLPRFTFGMLQLYDGIDVVVIAMGLFGISEILFGFKEPEIRDDDIRNVRLSSLLPNKKETKDSIWSTARGSLVGALVGLMPGAGVTMATIIAYGLEKKVSKTPEIFGTGAVQGITSAEAANNAAAQSAFIPTMALGIPGSSIMALMLGALMIHGITPGPMVISSEPRLFWGLVASFFIGNVLLLILNIPLIGLWLQILRIPRWALFPAVIFFICIGTFSLNNNPFDVFLVLLCGIFGTLMRAFGYPIAPLVLGFIIGPLLEEHVRRALLLSSGDASVFFTQPISASFLGLAGIILMTSLVKGMQTRRSQRRAVQQAEVG